jgi:hypothetical protein
MENISCETIVAGHLHMTNDVEIHVETYKKDLEKEWTSM